MITYSYILDIFNIYSSNANILMKDFKSGSILNWKYWAEE